MAEGHDGGMLFTSWWQESIVSGGSGGRARDKK